MNSSVHHLFREQTAGKKKRERTRGALLDSAISVFASKGYAATKITDITNHAELANGTFYNYYDDKDALLHDVAIGLAVEITSGIDAELQALIHAPTRVVLATARCLQIARQKPEWLRVLLESLFVVPEMQSAAVKYLRQDLKLGIEQGHFTIEINLLLVNQILSLIRTAAIVDPQMSDVTIQRTCEALLRLLGLSSNKAANLVTRVFKTHLEHRDA
jgi:AcrR family transcriptional regulator